MTDPTGQVADEAYAAGCRDGRAEAKAQMLTISGDLGREQIAAGEYLLRAEAAETRLAEVERRVRALADGLETAGRARAQADLPALAARLLDILGG